MTRWGPILEEVDDGSKPTSVIAIFVGCHIRTVRYHRRRRGIKKQAQTGLPQCKRCKMLHSERNPLNESKICLYCQLELAKINLLDWHESGDAEKYYKKKGIEQ